MKNALQCLIGFLLTSLLLGCLNLKTINRRVAINKEYTGWYLGSSNGTFFIIQRKGFMKRNIAFRLPEYPLKCRSIGITDSFFNYRNKKQGEATYIIINGDDTLSFNQKISLCRAKAFLSYIDPDYIKNALKKKEKIAYIMKASDGTFFVKSVWIDTFTDLQNIILFSNYNKDSAWYRKCDKISN